MCVCLRVSVCLLLSYEYYRYTLCTTTKRILLTRDYLETRFSKQTTAHFCFHERDSPAASLLQTDSAVATVDRPVSGTPTLLLLILTLMILLGMMIVADASTNRPAAGEKLLQLTASGFRRRTCSGAAACPIGGLHFQLLAQLRVVVQIKVQIAADGGDRYGVGHGRGNCISQTSSYFRHRCRRRPGFGGLRRRCHRRLFQQAIVSSAGWTIGEMIDQQRRRRRRRRR